MPRRHTTGWEVLGFGEDPTPGNPDDIRVLAGTYRELGDQAGEGVELLRGDGRIRNGKGQAMDALRERIREVPGMLERTRDSFRRASDAYRDYAGELEQAQGMLDEAIDIGQANEALAKTEVPASAPDAAPEQIAADDAERDRVAGARAELDRAVALGRQAESLRSGASGRASVTLRDAADDAIEERDPLKKIGDFLADNPIVELIAGIVIGIISVFFPVIGILLGAALLAFSVIRMVSQGKIDVGELLINILTLVPGGVLLGALGKIGASVAKVAKLAPLLAKFGKGTGTISAAVTKALQGSTAFRKFFGPLGKGIAGLKTNPALALAGKVAVDAGTDFTLGLTASAITAGVEKKPLDVKNAVIGAAIGAALAGGFAAFGGTALANNVKNAFTVKGKFTSNIDKAFSKQSFGFGPDGKFAFGNLLFVDGVGFPQKTGFHGLKGKTSSSAETGAVSTKITTPEGLATETKTDPGAQKPPQDGAAPPPVVTAKTTTPDGFTSETGGGINTITSPKGDTVVSDGTTTTVETPVPKGKNPLTTTLTPDGFTTSGPFGEISKGPDGTTIAGPRPPVPEAQAPGNGNAGNDGNANAPGNAEGIGIGNNPVNVPGAGNAGPANNPGNAGDGGQPPQPPPPAPPKFVIDADGIGMPGGGLSAGDNGSFNTVTTDTATITNENKVIDVFDRPGPGDGDLPVVSFTPGTGAITVNTPGDHTLTTTTGNPGQVTVDTNQVDLGANGGITFTNGGNGQTVTLPPPGATGPVTVQDGATTTAIGLDGTATVTTPGGPATSLGANGFSTSTGGANPTTVVFDGPSGTLGVTPGGGPKVTVDPAGGFAVGGVDGTGPGTGTFGGPGGSVGFGPGGHTLTPPGTDGVPFTVGPDGSFDGGGIQQAPNGAVTTGGTPFPTKIAPPDANGHTVVTSNGLDLTVGEGGELTVKVYHPGGEITVEQYGAQPTPAQPVNFGDAAIGLDAQGGPVFTVDAGQGTVLTVNGGVSTVASGPFTTIHGPGGLTTTLAGTAGTGGVPGTPGGTVSTGPAGPTTITQGPTTVTTNPVTGTTTVNSGTGGPTVTVTPAGADANTPLTVITSDGTASTLTDGGAQTSLDGAPVASATVETTADGPATTSAAPAGGHTTVTHGPAHTTAADTGGGFTVDDTQGIQSGGATIATGTDGTGLPAVSVTTPAPAGGAATSTVNGNGITSPGATVQTPAAGGVVVTPTPGGGAAPTTVGIAPDGALHIQGPGGSTADIAPLGDAPAQGPNQNPGGGNPGGGTVPGAAKVTNADGDTIATSGNTTTVVQNGFTTTFTGDGANGTTVTTVHDKSGTGHTIAADGGLTVLNPPGQATITATSTGGTVVTPPNTGPFLGHPELAGGGNILSNGQNGQPGPTVTTPGSDPVVDPGSTVVHHPGQVNGLDGVVTVTHGPATGSFAPGGPTELKPSGNQVGGQTIDTAGNPVGDQPGQTKISTVTGDGQGQISVPAFDGAGTLQHSGFFGGSTTIDTGTTTITKTTDGNAENASTPGQKSGVLDGPANPVDPAPKNPPVFTVGGTDTNGPGVEMPLKGGGATVHGGDFDVKAVGGGSFEVSVPGAPGGGAQDSVVVHADGSLTGPGVVQPPAAQGGQLPPPTITLGNGAVVTAGTPPTFTPPANGGTTTLTFNTNNGTATTHDPATGITIVQQPGGTAQFQNTAGGQNTTLTLTPGGVSGTVTTTGGNQPGTYTVEAGSSGAAQITDPAGQPVALDPGGSFHEQHSPSHDYDAHVNAPTATTEYHEYGYEAATNVIKGVLSSIVNVANQVNNQGADFDTAVQNAAVGLGNGVPNALANKALENKYGFKTGGLETALAAIPTKTIHGLDNNQDTGYVNPKPDPALASGG
ncbi:hypothetical protein ACFYXL_21700 [Streptomyces tsukubensis]|uniref:hypothetical protein n=1 Tax=Streptomyces tsukubensis TaxID=83656 RepID=UPI0036CD05AB